MIEGIKVKKLKVIPDERGFLMEMLRSDDPLFKKFGQVYVTGCKKGIAKAWHYHKEQTDHFICVFGKALVALCDLREYSSTFKKVQDFVLEAPPCKDNEPLLLKIPPWVAHGFTALDCEEARIINIPTLPYRYENPDEHRFSWDSSDIPYQWPTYVTKGG